MRIGIDARLINQTGVGRYIRNLIENLQEIDRKNEFVLFARSNDFDSVKSSIVNLPAGKAGSKWSIIRTDIRWHSIEEQVKFPKILNKEDLDLVHFPYFSVPIFYNKPFIVTIHDLIIHHFPTGKASTLPSPIYWSKILAYKYVISKTAQKAKKIIAVSNSTKDEIIDHLKIDPNKIIVTSEAVDDKIVAKPKKPKNIKFNKFFLFVGNVYPHKNVETLIKAFQKLDDKNAGLLFVGKEDYFYKKLKQKTNEIENIEFMDYVLDDELAWLYQNAVATVCPAFMEGFGLPALEAMVNSCLVIASDIPALREVCKDSAIYFDPKNPEELSLKMQKVLENKTKYKDLVENGFKRSQEFSWRKMSEQTLKIYENTKY